MMDISKREQELREELKKLLGLPPYSTAGNICYKDEHFLQSLIQKHGKRMVERIHQELLKSCKGCGKTGVSLNEKQLCVFCDKQFGNIIPVSEPKIKNTKITKISKKPVNDVQTQVDTYIELYKQFKDLEKKLNDMKTNTILPYMEENGLTEIKGSMEGKVEMQIQNRSPLTTRYTAYNLEDIEQFLSASARRKCIVKRVDKDILEGLMKTGEVESEIEELKVTKPVTMLLSK